MNPSWPYWRGDPSDLVEASDASLLLDAIARSRPAWHRDAACRGSVDVMYPATMSGPVVRHVIEEVCGGCTVRTECADHAVEHRERVGIWGGMTPSERRKARSTTQRGNELHDHA